MRPIRIIAHQLQHAIEVLESNATSESAIKDLFERIGVRTSASSFETSAALHVQAAVAKELAAAR